MRPTILVDLDDTLLSNEMQAFLPAYLQALSTHLAHLAEPQRLVGTLLAATKQMVLNRRPDCTLKEVFDAAFYPALGLDLVQVQGEIEGFYAEVFPTLKGLTSPRPGAVEFVEQAVGRGYRIVIATNPLFPRTAILQRLDWAGLPPEKYPFDLITSYETFHFAKPDPAYLAEILGRLGWPSGPVIMAGNDLQNDIAPARRLGLATYWLPPDGAPVPDDELRPTAVGSLPEIIPWIESLPAESLQPDYAPPSAMLATLRSTPAVLDTLSRDLSLSACTFRPDPDDWSPTEILCHLRDVEREVNVPRLEKVLTEHNPFLAGMDTDPWAEERKYITQSGPRALHHFIIARLKLIALLEAARPEDWQRSARHAIFGPTRLSELVSIIAGHDRLHIQQFQQTLKEIR